MVALGKRVVRRLLGALGMERGHTVAAGGVYDPHRQGVYDLLKEIVVPAGQAIYDPNVFGRYDLASQRVVSKESPISPDLRNWDVLMEEAQRQVRRSSVKLETDRYKLVLSLLPKGSGTCLDACTNQPLAWVRESVTTLGYSYVPVDLHGDGTNVRIEDLTKLTLSDSSVSCIMSLDTLEHIEDYRTALAELYRVLAPHGLAVFHVPCYYFEKETSTPIQPGVDPWGHLRYFSARQLVQDIVEAGFIMLRVGCHFDYGALLCLATKNPSLTQGSFGR